MLNVNAGMYINCSVLSDLQLDLRFLCYSTHREYIMKECRLSAIVYFTHVENKEY